MARIPRRQTQKAAVETFVRDAQDWLTPSDAPAVASLRAMADLLDREASPALFNAYGTAYRNLMARKPVEEDEPDPVDDVIRRARQDRS